MSDLNPHWRARLVEIQDLLLVAHEVDQVVQILIKLTNILGDEWGHPDRVRSEQALQLVREAFDLFNDPDSRVDLKDWNREARKILQEA